MITIQNQNFGVEIELTGIFRPTGAQVIADYFGTGRTRSIGTAYDTYTATDRKGRTWKCTFAACAASIGFISFQAKVTSRLDALVKKILRIRSCPAHWPI